MAGRSPKERPLDRPFFALKKWDFHWIARLPAYPQRPRMEGTASSRLPARSSVGCNSSAKARRPRQQRLQQKASKFPWLLHSAFHCNRWTAFATLQLRRRKWAALKGICPDVALSWKLHFSQRTASFEGTVSNMLHGLRDLDLPQGATTLKSIVLNRCERLG